ncbi:hypothetical protein N8Z97_00920 [Gammaproteobacteria bacterium]|nr:hypothetical protein [Gammaproteobacteria bacterium]
MKKPLALLLLFGIVGCSKEAPIIISCEVGDSTYSFNIDISNKYASRESSNPEYTTITFEEFDIRKTQDFYILNSKYDGSMEYKIHIKNLHLETSQRAKFPCNKL